MSGQDVVNWLIEHGIPILIIIVAAVAIYFIGKMIMRPAISRYVSAKGKKRHSKSWLEKRSQTLERILTSIFAILIGVIALFMILSEVGVDIGPLLAGAGVAGIAIGFGAQSLIKDLLSGLFVFLEDQYNHGDVVKVADITGVVEEINLRRTVLRDLDGILHTVPNGQITTSSNYTRDWSRVNLDIPVAYGEDIDHVMAVINRVGKELAKDKYFKTLIKTPPQALRVNNFGDSGIEIKILGDTRPMKQWEVTGELRKRLKRAFDEEGIEIPWPHVKLYFGHDKQDKSLLCQACSQVNLPGSKFCAHCGASLGS